MSKIFVDQVDPKTATTLTLGTSGDTVDIPTGVGLSVTDEVKTNKISPATGTAFALGDSGDTFTVPSGATIVNSGTATGFGGGKVLQVVQATTTTATSIVDSTTLTVVADLDVDITPSATDSKILVHMSCGGMIYGVTNAVLISMLRDTTVIVNRVRQGYYSGGATDWVPCPFSMSYLDSPSSTSSINYNFKWSLGASTSSGGLINPATGTAEGIVIAMEIGA